MDISAVISPSTIVSKNKFHILTHLPEHIALHGVAILYATERYESFNHVFRLSSIHSNRLSPSRDIAETFSRAARVLHLLQGGEWYDKKRGCQVRAGLNVRKYIQQHSENPHLLAFSQPTLNSTRKGPTSGVTQRRKQTGSSGNRSSITLCWTDTMASACFEFDSPHTTGCSNDENTWTQCNSVITSRGDTVHIDDCVLYDLATRVRFFDLCFRALLFTVDRGKQDSIGPAGANSSSKRLGIVREIIQDAKSLHVSADDVIITIDMLDIQEDRHEFYDMPAATVSSSMKSMNATVSLFYYEDKVLTVNCWTLGDPLCCEPPTRLPEVQV